MLLNDQQVIANSAEIIQKDLLRNPMWNGRFQSSSDMHNRVNWLVHDM